MNLKKVGIRHVVLSTVILIGLFLVVLDKPSFPYIFLIAASVGAWAAEEWAIKRQASDSRQSSLPASAQQKEEATAPTPPAHEIAGAPREETLLREIEALTKLVAAKTREAENLAAKLKDRRDLKILQRVGQFQHALDFNRAEIAGGKMSTEAAYREVELDLEAALAELGISAHDIPVGVHVRELPVESYELISADNPPSPEMAGTVNKVRQRALVYKDAAGQTHFLIPAKIDAYKI